MTRMAFSEPISLSGKRVGGTANAQLLYCYGRYSAECAETNDDVVGTLGRQPQQQGRQGSKVVEAKSNSGGTKKLPSPHASFILRAPSRTDRDAAQAGRRSRTYWRRNEDHTQEHELSKCMLLSGMLSGHSKNGFGLRRNPRCIVFCRVKTIRCDVDPALFGFLREKQRLASTARVVPSCHLSRVA